MGLKHVFKFMDNCIIKYSRAEGLREIISFRDNPFFQTDLLLPV